MTGSGPSRPPFLAPLIVVGVAALLVLGGPVVSSLPRSHLAASPQPSEGAKYVPSVAPETPTVDHVRGGSRPLDGASGSPISGLRYQVIFAENGLFPNKRWSVTFAGTNQSNTTAYVSGLNGGFGQINGTTITFDATNGTYDFSVATVPGYATPSPSSDTLVVDGASSTVPVAFYNVSYWAVGTTVDSYGLTTKLTADPVGGTPFANGAFDFSWSLHVDTIGCTQIPAGGMLNLTGATIQLNCPTIPSFSWYLQADEATPLLGWNPLSLYALTNGFANNGTYGGTAGVSFANVRIVQALGSPDVRLAVTVSIPGGGSPYPSLLNLTGYDLLPPAYQMYSNSLKNTLTFSKTLDPGGYVGSFESGLLYSLFDFTVADFSAGPQGPATYNVTFEQSPTSELPEDQSWGVVLNGTEGTASNASEDLVFSVENGTYAFSIRPETGYVATTNWSSPVDVNGADVVIGVTFTQVTYGVQFTEVGLPNGTTWTVTVNGSTIVRNQARILFSEPSGSYPYEVGAIPGYGTSPAAGTVVVPGANVSITVRFTLRTYPVTFNESGLPAGVTWNVTLPANGSTLPNETSPTGPGAPASGRILVALPNGTYPFIVAPQQSWLPDPASGNVTVAGRGVEVEIAFTFTYLITFQIQGGGAQGSAWSASLSGSSILPQFGTALASVDRSSSGTSLGFREPNGTYSYSISPPKGYVADPASGTVSVNGHAETVSVAWHASPSSIVASPPWYSAAGGWILVLGIVGAALAGGVLAIIARSRRGSRGRS